MSTTRDSAASKHSYRGIASVLVAIACVAACALPVAGGLLAGTFVDRFLDLPAGVFALVAAATGGVIFFALRRRAGSRGC